MAVVVATEVRRRLDVVDDTTNYPDALITHFIDVATDLVDQYVPSYNRTGSMYAEAQIQLAVKVADVAGRGTISVDPTGEYVAPAPSATAGLVKSAWAYVGPLTADGGGGFA